MRAENDNTDDPASDTVKKYYIDPSRFFDGQKIACGEYLFIVKTRDYVLPNGDIVQIAGVKPVKPEEKESQLIV